MCSDVLNSDLLKVKVVQIDRISHHPSFPNLESCSLMLKLLRSEPCLCLSMVSILS